MKATGKIIPLAFPDTFVRHSDERRVRFLRFFGLGTKTHIKAGHAALVLVNHDNGELHYFDFGRYVTPLGMGRVRSKKTDAELNIPFIAKFDEKQNISNINEILSWLQQNPQKTHGSGRLLASVGEVDFEKAFGFVKKIQDKPNVPYKAFGAGREDLGTNCSRLVTDCIIEGVSDRQISKKLRFNKRFTPSPIGNVEILANGTEIYSVNEGKVSPYNKTAFKENLVNFFDKKFISAENEAVKAPENSQYLSGIGSGAYFRIEPSAENHIYKITRFNDIAQVDCIGFFEVNDKSFSIKEDFNFVYNSHCYSCRIEQGGKIFEFSLKESLSQA